MKRMQNFKGITLIALIITIIVMLILVAVTINVALNGGLFTKAKEATFKTEIQQIQEQILVEKASQMADNEINGTNISIDDLNISTELKNKYRNKLSITSDGTLQYNDNNCTEEEKSYFASINIEVARVNIEDGIYVSTIHPGQMEWEIEASFRKKYGILFTCCFIRYNNQNIQDACYLAITKDNGDGTYLHNTIIGPTTYNFNIEPPTVTYGDEHINLEESTVELTKQNGSLFDTYSPDYNDFTKENDETLRVYNGIYINESRNDFLHVNIIKGNNTLTTAFAQEDLEMNIRNSRTNVSGSANEMDYYTELMEDNVLDDGTVLEFSGKTITATDTNDNVTTYTLIEFD